MEMTMRWYGTGYDTVTLKQIKQTRYVTGVITTLYDTQPGEVWSREKIRALKQEICAGNSVIDCRNIPDLVPVMSVLAAVSPGTTTFTHAERLRIKESDRIRSSIDMLTALGAEAEETEDGLKVTGRKSLRGGTVSSAGDHRIAMSAAIASIVCEGPVIIEGAEAVQKVTCAE